MDKRIILGIVSGLILGLLIGAYSAFMIMEDKESTEKVVVINVNEIVVQPGQVIHAPIRYCGRISMGGGTITHVFSIVDCNIFIPGTGEDDGFYWRNRYYWVHYYNPRTNDITVKWRIGIQ